MSKAKAAKTPFVAPTLKVGDTVNYQPVLGDPLVPARVAAVHEGHDGRLLDLTLPDGRLQPDVPFRPDLKFGNTWSEVAKKAKAEKPD